MVRQLKILVKLDLITMQILVRDPQILNLAGSEIPQDQTQTLLETQVQMEGHTIYRDQVPQAIIDDHFLQDHLRLEAHLVEVEEPHLLEEAVVAQEDPDNIL